MNVLELARPDILALEAYSSARAEGGGETVLLNANESPWPPHGAEHPWNRYPEPQPAELIARLAGLHGVAPENVFVGRGSGEGIDLLVRGFCRAGRDAILTSPPTFGLYAVCARVQGADVVEAPLGADFGLDVDALLAAVTPAVKLVFVCAPNNPVGTGVARDDILRLADALVGRALVVVDEAYVEFAGSGVDAASVATYVGEVENLVVLRTLSKAWALAGARIGAVLADARVIGLLHKLMAPYPLPAPCVEVALAAMSAEGCRAMRQHVEVTVTERERMRRALEGLSWVREVLPSQANFLTVRMQDPEAALTALRAAGIAVRDVRRYPRLDDALRITIGTPGENGRVLDVLRAVSPVRNCAVNKTLAEPRA